MVVHPGPAFSVADVYEGLVKGLRANGVEVGVVNLGDRLTFFEGAQMQGEDDKFTHAFQTEEAVRMAANSIKGDIYDFWPDHILVVSGFFITPEIWGALAYKNHHTTLWCTESPYEDEQQAQPARYVDTVILNDPVSLDRFQTINPRSFYLPHSYDPGRHHPGLPEPILECDFTFVGTGFPSRVEFFEKVDFSDLTVRMAGNWQTVTDDSPLKPYIMGSVAECLDNADTVRLYRSAKVNANLYRKEINEGGSNEGWAIGPREVELAACESFFLREPRGEGDALFPMMPTFETPVEFSDALRWWLAHPDERASAAAQAREAIAQRTFTNTAARWLRLVDGVPHSYPIGINPPTPRSAT